MPPPTNTGPGPGEKALGHGDVSTTTIYTHLLNEELREALRREKPERVLPPFSKM